MDKIFEELVAELDDLGFEFLEVPEEFLPENNEEQEPASKKAKLYEITDNESDLSKNVSASELPENYSSKNCDTSHVSKEENDELKLSTDEKNQPSTSKEIDDLKPFNKENQIEVFESVDKEDKNSKEIENKKEISNDVDLEKINEDSVEPERPPEGFCFPIDFDSSDMLEEVDFPEDGPWHTPTQRYFTPYYQLDVQSPGDDMCLLIHSNRICMITLAPSHIIFQENKTIENINFKVSEKLDRTQNKVSGKSKHGAQPLQNNSNLCCINCTDGTKYMIKCCMIGKLFEINDGLIEFPDMLKLEPHFGGYIAIVLPNLKHLDNLKEKLLNQEQYNEAIKKRMENKEYKVYTQTEEEKNQLFLKLCKKMNADAEKYIRDAENKKKEKQEQPDKK